MLVETQTRLFQKVGFVAALDSKNVGWALPLTGIFIAGNLLTVPVSRSQPSTYIVIPNKIETDYFSHSLDFSY